MNGEKSRTKRKGKILKAIGMLRDVSESNEEITAVDTENLSEGSRRPAR